MFWPAFPGRKALVEFTGGITQTGEENRTQLRAATDAANRADVSIYSIDSRGLFAAPPGGDASTNAATGTSMFTGASVFHQTDQREDSRDTLATLSTDTGGKAFFDLGDLSEALPKIQQDNGGYYLIGYRLGADVKRDGRWRSIHVKVNAPGAHVRYREGYYAPRDFQHLEKESRDQQLADAVNSDNPIVELPVAVETQMFRLSDQQTYVPVAAKIAASALDWAEKHGHRQAEFDFAVEVRAVPSRQIVAQLRDTTQVNLDPARYEQINQKNLLYQGGVVLAPGNYRLKFVARENESGKIGTFEQNLVVPATQPGKVTLSSVVLSSQLVPVQKSTEVQTKGQGAARQARNFPARNERRDNRPQRHAPVHAKPNSLRLFPSLLSGKNHPEGFAGRKFSARGPDLFPQTACRLTQRRSWPRARSIRKSKPPHSASACRYRNSQAAATQSKPW